MFQDIKIKKVLTLKIVEAFYGLHGKKVYLKKENLIMINFHFPNITR